MDTLTVYHGTSRERGEKIKHEGLRPATREEWEARGEAAILLHTWGRAYVTSDKETAEIYATDSGDGVVIEFRLPREWVKKLSRGDELARAVAETGEAFSTEVIPPQYIARVYVPQNSA